MSKTERKKWFDVVDYNNLKELILDAVRRFPNNIAFTIKHKENKSVTYQDITYTEFLEDINKMGTAMYELGFKDKRVAIIGKNRYEWVLTHFSNLLGGMVSVPLDKDLQYDELESSLIRSKADAIVFDEKLEPMLKQIKDNGKVETLKEYICMSKLEGYKSIPELLKRGEDLLSKGQKEYVDYKVDDNRMAILLFTSGTTSKSKAVMLSQRNVAATVYGILTVEDFRPTDTNIAFLPFHHIFGSSCITMILSSGIRTVFPDGLRYIKQNLKEYKVSVFIGVPALIEAMYKTIMKEVEKQGKTKLIKIATKISRFLLKFHIDIRRKLFKQILDELGGELRFVVSGGAPADPDMAQGFNDFGIVTVQGYGLSETAPVIAGEDFKLLRRGSVGKPMLNDTIEIVNPDENGIGEVRVKGPNVMLGYYEMPELTAQVLKDGWFYTGDLGYFDKDGFLFLTGRNKDMIVLRNGKKVFPEELEMLVNRLDLVSESMVFGMPEKKAKDDYKVSVKVVYDEEVIKEKYSDKSEEELYELVWEQIKEVNKTFPKYKHIQKLIVSHEELIKTTTKKVKRQEEMKKILAEEN